MTENCSSCRFWVRVVNTPARIGECRRYPPSRNNVQVADTYWCGEHEARSATTDLVDRLKGA